MHVCLRLHAREICADTLRPVEALAYQSDSITPAKPHVLRSTVLLIQPFAHDGVPLIASYAHLHAR